MPAGLAILIAVCSLLSLATGVYFGVVIHRVRRTRRRLPTAADGLGLPEPEGGWPALCVVVPAHDEADVIATLVRSLRDQDYPRLRVVLALDRCTDDTEAVARGAIAGDERFEIVIVEDCPDDWAGKVHAVHEGMTRAEGPGGARLLLFTDADTRFEPGLCRAAAALLLDRDLGLLSLLSRLSCTRWYERIVQPAAGFELVRLFPLDVVNRSRSPRAFANGQFMLFRRELYDAIGGHERVKDALLEDIAFARHLKHRSSMLENASWGVYLSGGLLHCSMYRSWDSFTRGWRRIFTEAAGKRPRAMRKAAWRQRLFNVLFPLACYVSVVAGLVALAAYEAIAIGGLGVGAGAVGAGIYHWALASIYKNQAVHRAWSFLFPVGAWICAGLQSRAAGELASGAGTTWAGRRYVREART